MKVACLYSGGKDSTYALYVAQQRGWEISSLITVVPRNTESMMYHVPNLHLVPKLAECLEIPLLQKAAGDGENEELDALRSILEESRVDAIVTGTIASEYQKSRIDSVCHAIGLGTFSPLWQRNQVSLLDDYISAGFKILIVGAAAEGLDKTWLGRELDEDAKRDLLKLHGASGVSLCGEGGEYESLVVDGPNFHKKLNIVKASVEWQGTSGIFRVLESTVLAR